VAGGTNRAGGQGRRPRARDIADVLGVSQTAVSFALNGRPGISEETRERILSKVREMGWSPNSAARALTGARSSTLGFAVARAPEDVGSEAFFLQLIAGMQSVLSAQRYGLLFQVVPSIEEEIALYRRWSEENRVDGVVVVDLRVDDDRPRVLKELGLPALIAGARDPLGRIPSVSFDDAVAMRTVVDHLVSLGHRAIAYVSGEPAFEHIRRRREAFTAATEEGGVAATVETADFTAEGSARATLAALARMDSPGALVFENEVMAVAGIETLRTRGRSVPGDLAVVSMEDSLICTAMRPQITALHRDTLRFGAVAAQQLRRAVDGEDVRTRDMPSSRLMIRGSTDPSVEAG
jgi:DNA-binding LacI/PurR family transcriptional regulator